MKALLVIDMQNDFMPGGPLAVDKADTLIEFINQKMKGSLFVIATMDDHPANHVSFASTHKKNVGDVIHINHHTQILWPAHCIHGTKGAEFHPELLRQEIDFVVQKGIHTDTDSYSAFFDNKKVYSTNLDTILRKAGVTSLEVVGVATEYCVKYTVIDALDLGYAVEVYKQGCKGISTQGENQAYLEMGKKGAILID